MNFANVALGFLVVSFLMMLVGSIRVGRHNAPQSKLVEGDPHQLALNATRH